MIDINCDMGESLDFLNTGHDESLMPYISSVNIACGFHAGNQYIMAKTIENALRFNLKIGAHPGFDDLANFGRREIELTYSQIKDLITRQLILMSKVIEPFGVGFNHVKPHGALYNMSAKRIDYAQSIAEAVNEFDSSLTLLGLSGSFSTSEARNIGLYTMEECFADRTYMADGSLANRILPNAVKKDIEEVKKQAHSLKNGLEVLSFQGTPILLKCDTICLHSDTPQSLAFAKAIYTLFNDLPTDSK